MTSNLFRNNLVGFLSVILLLLIVLILLLFIFLYSGSGTQSQQDLVLTRTPTTIQPHSQLPEGEWAFAESFSGLPNFPSQELLPKTFDYSVTHQTHPAVHFTKTFPIYMADHDELCAGPDPNLEHLPQHEVQTSNISNGTNKIDPSFYICKDHMMSSMGDVEGYSASAFWPKQEFNFEDGGVLQWDVNLNGDHKRVWYEVLIIPKEILTVSAAQDFLPLDEEYPEKYIALRFGSLSGENQRDIELISKSGEVLNAVSENWSDKYPDDRALRDKRIRRTNSIQLNENSISWSIAKENEEFDTFKLPIADGLSFHQGLVLFTTHAYTPTKDGNYSNYTFHWDNIVFDGPVVGKYDVYEASDVVYIQGNGNRLVGDNQTVKIQIDEISDDMVLFGQIHNAVRGEVLLSINGSEQKTIHPYSYTYENCYSTGWKSFQTEIDPALLKVGENEFNWVIGNRSCAVGSYPWVGFSVKDLEIQY